MSNYVRLIRVFISSPDDVVRERDIVRELIYDWNSIFSIANKIVLLPVGWDKELKAGYGGAPQEKVNKELLPHCELLIGIFGTKIGSRTENYASGTIEEIERHTLCGKDALLFFRDLKDGEIEDRDEHQKLQEYKESIQGKCVYIDYSSADDFKNKLRTQLNHHMQKNIEAYWKSSIEQSLPKEDDNAKILKYNIDHWGMKLELESMKGWISSFTSNVLRINSEKYDSLHNLMLWMLDRTWGEGHEKFKDAFEKFRIILNDMLVVISQATITNKNGDYELKYNLNERYYDQDTYEYMLKTNEFNEYLIKDYAAELCRATNFILDLYRKKVNPSYLIEFGKVYITSGLNYNMQFTFMLTEYRDTKVIPYIGYEDFLVSRKERDFSFGAGKSIEDPIYKEWRKSGY